MPQNLTIEAAAAALKAGEIIAYPTEAVWGLGCDPMNETAVRALLALKQRDPEKGLILIAATAAYFEPFMASPSENAEHLIQQYWPGTTLLLRKSINCPFLISGTHATVALRLTNHPTASALSDLFKGALVSTSANPTTLPPARSEKEVRAYFGERIKILPGHLGDQKTVSRIIDAESGAVLR